MTAWLALRWMWMELWEAGQQTDRKTYGLTDQTDKATDRHAENDEGIYTDNLFNNFMSSKSNKSYKRQQRWRWRWQWRRNDSGIDDDGRSEARHRETTTTTTTSSPKCDAHQVKQSEGGRQRRSRRVVVGRLFGFRFGFLERRSSHWIDAQSFGWMKRSVWE